TSGNPTVAFVDTTGRVKGENYGQTTVAVMERESGLAVSVPVTVGSVNPQHIYISDLNNNRIVRMDDMSGTNWRTYGTFGSGTGQFQLVQGIYVDAQGRMYASDVNNNRIVRVNGDTTRFVAYSDNSNPFIRPGGVTLDSQDRIYIADNGQRRVVRIDDMN